MNVTIDEVHAIIATADESALQIDVSITDADKDISLRFTHSYRVDDPNGLSPLLKAWMEENDGAIPVTPYVPIVLTPEEIRAQMLPLTARRFWLAAASIGVTEDSAVASVQGMADLSDVDKADTIIELRKASEFDRLHPAIIDLSTALAIPAEQIDDLWIWASTL